ncbi:MAG: helix-hairpin-helix domain-containing protein [Bacteroidota bacterium]
MFKFLLNSVARALGFSKVEARGTLILIILIFSCIVCTRVYVSYIKKPKITSIQQKEELDKWVKEVQQSYQVKEQNSEVQDRYKYIPKSNFAQKRQKLNTPLAEKVAPPSFLEEEKEKNNAMASGPIDINEATTQHLESVRGIGPTYAKRIIKFREALGGFSDAGQLEEVYGLPTETIPLLQDKFQVLSGPNPLNINADSAKILARHPYINYDIAWIIINFRKQHGDITSIEDLKKIQAIDQETIEKLRPYLD